MISHTQLSRALAGKPWYVHEQKMQELFAFLSAASPEQVKAMQEANKVRAARGSGVVARSGSIAGIAIYGMISHRSSWMQMIFGGTSTEQISQQLQQAVSNSSVGSIVLDIDSPGGDVDGVEELASEIFAARKQKKITAVSNCLCASAAYYLASQATEIVVSPSSLTGSIGVYTTHEDDSAMLDAMGVKISLVKFGENKAEGNNLGPLSDSARAHLQEMVDNYGNAFERAVARGRGITQNEVHSKFGQGRVFDAKTAVRIGMADMVGTLTNVVSAKSGGPQAQHAAFIARDAEFARMKRQLQIAKLS